MRAFQRINISMYVDMYCSWERERTVDSRAALLLAGNGKTAGPSTSLGMTLPSRLDAGAARKGCSSAAMRPGSMRLQIVDCRPRFYERPTYNSPLRRVQSYTYPVPGKVVTGTSGNG